MASIVAEQLAFRLSRYKGFGWAEATGRPPEMFTGDYVAFHAASAIYSAELAEHAACRSEPWVRQWRVFAA